MRLYSFLIIALLMYSCKTDQELNGVVEISVPERGELSKDSQILLGNRLFSEKTCITCHAVDHVIKGPSVKEIMVIYSAKNGDIVAFLKGKAQPIVDTISSQIDIMQKNIDGFLKEITDEELNSIAVYMMHIDELN